MYYQNDIRPRLKTVRNLLLSGAFAVACGTMAIGCSSISSWWRSSRSGSSANISYNANTSYNSSAPSSYSPSAPGSSRTSMNNPAASETNPNVAPNNNTSAAVQENASNLNYRHGRMSMRRATHLANEREARAAALDFAPQVSADIGRANGSSASRARDLYQRGEQELSNNRPERALRDFNRAERLIQTSMNTSESSKVYR